MSDKQCYVVLSVIDGKEGWMATYSPQVAMVHEYDSPEQAACFNVGSHPHFDAEALKTPGRSPYRTIVIPWEHWREFEVFSELIEGTRDFRAYPSEHRTIEAL